MGPTMSDLADLFPGFASKWVNTSIGRMFVRLGGKGPSLLLLHGYPQTSVMWHRVAPLLAPQYTLVIPDLPGYGWSVAPRAQRDHAPYDKRWMPTIMIEIMEQLGFARFRLAGHDRGGRVAYRLALDHPGRLERLAVLDIVPTWAMWHRMDARLANRAWHWMFLALPAPFPETLIGKDPRYFFDTRAAAGTKIKKISAFDPRGRRPHQRSRPRRGNARGGGKNLVSGARDLGRRRRHSSRYRRPARHLARMGD